MNILFLDSIERQTYGGMEEWIRLAATGLMGRGHGVTVCGRPDSEFLRRMAETIPSHSIVELSLSTDFNPITIQRIRRLIAQREIDIVVTNFNKDIRMGGLAARLEGNARVIWSAGLDITRNNIIHRILTPRLIDGVIVPSAALKRQITRLGYIPPELVKVIPIGISDCVATSSKMNRREFRQRYNLPDNAIVAVTSGRFVEQKGHIFLVEAARRLCSLMPDLHFLLLGDGPLQQLIEQSVKDYKLKQHFAFAGMLDKVKLEEALAAADLMIHPSIEEPFGISILEGMRAGLPIVASRVGGIPEVVAENSTALLVVPGEPNELGDAVVHLLADKEKMRMMGEAGKKRWREKFGLESMIDRIEAYLIGIASLEQVHGEA